jgi:hypothetical protein
MCRYAIDLQPMLKVLAGQENIERLLHIDVPVNLSKLRYFYIDEIDAYFVNKVDHDQKAAHRRVRSIQFYFLNRLIFTLNRSLNISKQNMVFMLHVYV